MDIFQFIITHNNKGFVAGFLESQYRIISKQSAHKKLRTLDRSFIHRKNYMGPKIDHWGVPTVAALESEIMSVLIVSVKHFSMSYRVISQIPQRSSFRNKMKWLTLPNALPGYTQPS